MTRPWISAEICRATAMRATGSVAIPGGNGVDQVLGRITIAILAGTVAGHAATTLSHPFTRRLERRREVTDGRRHETTRG